MRDAVDESVIEGDHLALHPTSLLLDRHGMWSETFLLTAAEDFQAPKHAFECRFLSKACLTAKDRVPPTCTPRRPGPAAPNEPLIGRQI